MFIMEVIKARMILEVLGRPKENVESAIKALIDKISAEKGIKIEGQTIHEIIPVKDAKNLFTTFAELSVEFASLPDYFNIMFAYMPSNIEIISPSEMKLKNADMNFIGNRLIQRLHDYDAIVKKTLMDKEIYARKLYEVAPHLFKKPEQQSIKNDVQEKPKKAKKKKSKKS